MADSAFKPGAYPGFTIAELQAFIEQGRPNAAAMQAEIERRGKVAAGDTSVMTDGERLRYARGSKHHG